MTLIFILWTLASLPAGIAIGSWIAAAATGDEP